MPPVTAIPGRWPLIASPAFRAMSKPRDTYAEALHAPGSERMWAAARRPCLVALIQGIAISMAATESVALPVVASVTAYWAPAVLVQVLAALVLIRSGPTFASGSQAGSARRVPLARALDLFFLGHAPWSLWLLLSAGVVIVAPSVSMLRWIVMAGMIVPAAVTARIVAAFSQVVLGCTRRESVRRTILHQGLTLGVLVVYIAITTQLWPRVVALLP
jgi:hypothetical protein